MAGRAPAGMSLPSPSSARPEATLPAPLALALLGRVSSRWIPLGMAGTPQPAVLGHPPKCSG